MRKRRMIMKWGRGVPPFIATTIFSKLVISNLPSCRLVCKTWNDLVLDYASSSKFQFLTNAFLLSTSDPVLDPISKASLTNPKLHSINLPTTKHLDDVDFDLELEFIKSGSLQFHGHWSFIIINNQCNGLMYISKYTFYSWCYGIFNPMTNEFIQIPESDDDIYVFGFGYSPTTKQYKLFRVVDSITYSKTKTGRSIVPIVPGTTLMDILTFGRSGTNPSHNQWRHLHTLTFGEFVHNGAYMNGVIYWLVKEKDKRKEYFIYALDVETEQIELSVVLQIDPKVGGGRIYQFNGTIYATFYIVATVRTIQVWKMQAKGSWIKEFVIDDIPKGWGRFDFIKVFEDGEILCMINMDFFCFYNSFSKRKKIMPKNQEKFRYICPIESLNFGSLPEILEGMES